MRQCLECEEYDFEYVYGSVWKCTHCGTLSGELKDLEELQRPKEKKKEVKIKRKLVSYRSVTMTCETCRGEVFVMKYPEENEFKKLQGAWKKHKCKTLTEHFI